MKKLHPSIRRGILFFATCFMSEVIVAQQQLQLAPIDISQVKFEREIQQNIAMCYAEVGFPVENLSSLPFQKGLIHKKNLPHSIVSKRPVFYFNLINSADSTVSVYFFPGRYFHNVTILKLAGTNKLEKIPDVLPDNPNNLSYRKITIAAKENASLYIILDQVKTYTNRLNPRLINTGYINSFISAEENFRPQLRYIGLLICGLLLMMVLFSLVNFFQGANKEFFYYSGYALFLGLLFSIKALGGFRSNSIAFFLDGYLDFILLCVGHLFYFSFIQRFLNTKEKYPFAHKLCNTGKLILILSMLAYTLFNQLSNSYSPEYFIENITKFLLLMIAIFFVFYAGRNRSDRIFNFLFWGNLSLLVFSCISYLLTFFSVTIASFSDIFISSIFYYQMGVFFELVFFLAGISYKNKMQIIEQTRERERLKAENQLKEYEKQLAVLTAQKEERSRISLDMHDELGSGMTAIRLMSELARAKMKENSPVEIDRISDSANDVLNKMNAIIWSMNSGNDTLDNLVSYIRIYALEYFENTPIKCIVNTPEHIEKSELSGDKRRNVFLCVKETLNNALKHSSASEIIIDIQTNNTLVISIHDNGKGIDMQNLRQFGNGLKNIQKRMETIEGSFAIENKNGTTTTLILPLASL
jgi:signal transduction histidine kinase